MAVVALLLRWYERCNQQLQREHDARCEAINRERDAALQRLGQEFGREVEALFQPGGELSRSLIEVMTAWPSGRSTALCFLLAVLTAAHVAAVAPAFPGHEN